MNSLVRRHELVPTGLCLLALWSGWLSTGCSGDAKSTATEPIILRDTNNYRATGSLSLPIVETASGTDLDICWTDVATDIQCHPVVPQNDLDNVGLLRLLHLTEAQAQEKLISDTLQQSEVDGYVEFRTDHTSTCTKLSQFSFFGTAIDVPQQYQQSADESYLLLFTHGTTPGLGARAMTFIRPTASSTNTLVNAPSGCGMLSFNADLTLPAKVSVATTGPWIVEWGNMTVDGQGKKLAFANLDRLLLGFYRDMTVDDLQAQFFDIETLASSLWDLPLTSSYSADLSLAQNRATGATFDGFSQGTGSWILGLFCTTCRNPAPLILVVLEPKGGQ